MRTVSITIMNLLLIIVLTLLIFLATDVRARSFRCIKISTISAGIPFHNTWTDLKDPFKQPKWQTLCYGSYY